MTQNRRLLLVTNDYPYPDSEQFLETEIETLRRHFTTIDVVAVNHVHRRAKPRPRSVPLEVRIVDLGAIDGWQAARACAHESPRLAAQAVLAARHAGVRNPMGLFSLMAIVIRRCDVARRIIRAGLLEPSHAVYAYWANTTAYLLAELRAMSPRDTLPQPFVTRAHGYDLWAERAGLRHLPFQPAVIAACDRVCPCSDRGAEYLREHYPAHAQKIHRFYLGVAPQPTAAATSTDGVLRLLTCSQLVPVKRLHRLAEAMGRLRRRVLWTHLGDGPEGPALREMCARLDPPVRAEFPGAMPHQAVLEFYRTHPVDLFVNTSASEGVPVSIMEALSFGVPVLATSVGGVSELVRPDVGRLLPSDFPVQDLVACLENHTNSEYDRKHIQQWQQHAFSTANYEAFAAQALCRPPRE
jgi:glycosyltransferase involved in cell wall biosynthesis